MANPELERIVDSFWKNSRDPRVKAAGSVAKAIFNRDELYPPADIRDREAQLIQAVDACFSPQLRRGLQRIFAASNAVAESLRLLDAEPAATGTADVSELTCERIADNLQVLQRLVYDEFWQRGTSVLAFLFMITANRLGAQRVLDVAPEDAARCVGMYRKYYEHPEGKPKDFSKRDLNLNLLQMFRKLYQAGVVGDTFVLHRLLPDPRDLNSLFPPRFDGELSLFVELRNIDFHEAVMKVPSLADGMLHLIYDCVLDMVATIAPILENFFLVYITEEGPPMARGVSFAGETSRQVQFRAADSRVLDAEAIKANQLYLIDRRLEAGRGENNVPALTPASYINLTPLLIYDIMQGGPGKEEPFAETSRSLFVFRHFAERAGIAEYIEAMERDSFSVKPGKSGARSDILYEVGRFRKDLFKFGKAEAPVKGLKAPHSLIQVMTWQMSGDSLASVMDVDAYAPDGTRSSREAGASRSGFVEELYTAPAEEVKLHEFLGIGRPDEPTAKPGFVVLGGAGAGKTNLLSRAFLEERRAGRLSLFFAARFIEDADLAQFLDRQIAVQISYDWNLDELKKYAAAVGQTFTVFIDAANECHAAGGAFQLLDSIRRMAGVLPSQGPSAMRVVVSCRQETWALYQDHKNIRLLDRNHFYTPEPLLLRAFEEPARQAELFAKYQRHFRLLPQRHDQLEPAVRNMLRSPLIMSIVAETYSNAGDGGGRRSIPAEMDYYTVFSRLTKRKLDDAQQLFGPEDPRHAEATAVLEKVLRAYTKVLYEQIRFGGGSDAASWTDLWNNAATSDYLRKPAGRPELISTFDALVQTGLVERIDIAEEGFGTTRTGRAFKFFHDQYAQFAIAGLYQSEVLGAIDLRRPIPPARLTELTGRIAKLVDDGVQKPVLGGAIDHWLHRNLSVQAGGAEGVKAIDRLIPLLSLLARHDLPAVSQYAAAFLTKLPSRGALDADTLLEVVFKRGGEPLKVALASYFIESWPGVPASFLTSFIHRCDPAGDVRTLRRLASVFAHHFETRPEEVLQYFDDALRSVEGAGAAFAMALELTYLTRIKSYGPEFNFLAIFGAIAGVANFNSTERLVLMRDFLKIKYPWLLDTVMERTRDGSGQSIGESIFRTGAYKMFEQMGYGLWDEVAGAQADNDSFWVRHNGVCQAQKLNEYFDYVAGGHNRDYALLNLDPGSRFRNLSLELMSFQPMSMIGYVACVAMSVRLAGEWDKVGEVIHDLVEANTPSSRFFAGLVLTNLSFMNPDAAPRAMDLLVSRLVPAALEVNAEYEDLLLNCLGITCLDLATFWPQAEPAFRLVVERLRERGDAPAIDRYRRRMLKVSFFDNAAAGARVIELHLSEGLLDDPLWEKCMITLMAGLYARSPAMLRGVLESYGYGDAELTRARAMCSDAMMEYAENTIAQFSWNHLVVAAMAHERAFSYLLTKVLVCGLGCCNNLPQFAKEFRRFVVEFLRAYFTDDTATAHYERYTAAEARAEAFSTYREGAGEAWIPKRPRQKHFEDRMP